MSRKTYSNFDLYVEPTPDGYRARVDSSAGGAKVDFDLPLLKEKLANLSKTANDEEAVKAVGSYLYDQIFQKELHSRLQSSLRQAEQQKKGLRIRLRLDSPEVAALPWEYLYDQTRNRFFCLSSNTPLVRCIELSESETPLPVKPPLRVLVMISAPLDWPPLDVKQEWTRLRQAVSKLEQQGLLKVKLVTKATIEALRDQLQDNDYHIFHFIGHGIFDEYTQQGMIIFENEKRMSERISAQKLGILLHDSPIRLALLNTCQGGRTSQNNLFAGVAQNLVQQEIPAVIAMQFNIKDRAAIRCAHEFYKAIGKKFPIDAALAEARKAIYTQGKRIEWGTPVLYMRAPDGHLFDIEQKPTIEAPLLSEKADSANKRPEQKTEIEVTASAQTEKLLHEKAQESMSDGIGVDPLVELRLPFTNRKRELDFICGPESPQHIQIYAPSGYGKTELLQKVKADYEQKGWQVVWVDFSRPEHTGCAENELALVAEVARQSGLERLTSQTPADAVRELARHWKRNGKQTILLFDSLEYLTDSQMLAWMKKEFFRSLAEKYIPAPKIRPKVVAAGRRRVRKWSNYAKPNFHFHQLNPLNKPQVVDELLGNVIEQRKLKVNEFGNGWFHGMRQEIMQMTKGHPKCMTNVLAKADFDVRVQGFIEERPQIYHNYVKPILENEILVAVREDDEFLYQMLPTMSVLRGMNLSLIHYLNEQGLIPQTSPTPDLAKELLAKLKRFELVVRPNRNRPLLYQFEKVVRQLLALQLELSDQERYLKLHALAARMYDSWIIGKDERGQPPPNILADGMQAHAICEGLYHHGILFAQQLDGAIPSQLVAKLAEQYLPCLRTATHGEDISTVATLLVDTLQEDSELKNLVVGEVAFARLLEPVRQLAEH